jgi:hypothetical protein
VIFQELLRLRPQQCHCPWRTRTGPPLLTLFAVTAPFPRIDFRDPVAVIVQMAHQLLKVTPAWLIAFRRLGARRKYARNALARLRSRGSDEAHSLGAGRPKTLLEFRFDRHMRMVHRALDQIRELNPKGTTRDDLSEQVWDTLVERGEWTFLDIVDAEVRFWAPVIAHNPAIRLGESEALWVGRIVRLANIIRNSADRRREELAFLRDRFSRGILTCHREGEDNMTMDTPLAPERWLSGSCHASRIPALRGRMAYKHSFGRMSHHV